MFRASMAGLSTAQSNRITCDGVFETMKLLSVTDGSPRRRSMSLIV